MKPLEPAAPAAATPAPETDSHPRGAGLARSAGVIGLATMTSRVLGLVRDMSLANLFGASNAMDAFYVAFRIPNLMRDLFAEGTMSAAFVPTFTRRLITEGRDAAWRLGTQLINALIVITGILVLAGIIFAEPLTRLFARDFGEVPGKLELTVDLTRMMLPFLTLVAVAAACMGMLNSLRRFFMPALSPAMFNISVILCAVVLVPQMPRGVEPIMAIAFGVVLGGVGQIALQYWVLRREGFRYRVTLNLADRGLREVLRLMGPGTLAGAALQLNLLVNTILATGQGTGAVSWLTWAFRVMYLPIGVFGVSIATAALPVLSRQAALGELQQMRRTISHSLRLMLMLMVPATVGLVVLAVPVVRLIFERGSFTPADTQATSLALVCYAPAIIGYSAVRLAVPSFYQPDPRPRQCRVGRSQHRAEPGAGPGDGLPGARARHRHRSTEQRHAATGASTAAARRPGGRQNRGQLRPDHRRRCGDGRRRVAGEPVAHGALAWRRIMDAGADRRLRSRRGSGGPGRRGAVAWRRRVQSGPASGPGTVEPHPHTLTHLVQDVLGPVVR